MELLPKWMEARWLDGSIDIESREIAAPSLTATGTGRVSCACVHTIRWQSMAVIDERTNNNACSQLRVESCWAWPTDRRRRRAAAVAEERTRGEGGKAAGQQSNIALLPRESLSSESDRHPTPTTPAAGHAVRRPAVPSMAAPAPVRTLAPAGPRGNRAGLVGPAAAEHEPCVRDDVQPPEVNRFSCIALTG